MSKNADHQISPGDSGKRGNKLQSASEFNPQRARTKRPLPLWVEAFHTKTRHLSADEIGAYMMILMIERWPCGHQAARRPASPFSGDADLRSQ